MKTGSTEWQTLLENGAQTMNVSIDTPKIDQLTRYALELLKWNRKINLTSITDPLEVAVKHLLDSAVPTNYIPPGSSLVDIGSGGGFPGIVIKVLNPSLSVTLIDSSIKKVNFLKHIIRTLNLNGIEALHTRAELLSEDPGYGNRFDVAICRAFSKADNFIKTAIPFLTGDGLMIAMKGKNAKKEMDSIKRLLDQLPEYTEGKKSKPQIDVKGYTLPYLNAKRYLIIVR